MGNPKKKSQMQPKSSAKKINEKQRAMQALELRKSGYSFRRIAEALGYADESGARKAVNNLLSSTITESVDSFRAIQLERLDQLLVGVWSDAIKGHHGAIDRVLKIEDRRAKLLGLDAPSRTEVTGPDGQRLEIQLRPDDLAGLFQQIAEYETPASG